MSKLQPFEYGNQEPVTLAGAKKRMLEFISVCQNIFVKEKSYHLYSHDGYWKIVADSVKDKYGEGEHIKEFEL